MPICHQEEFTVCQYECDHWDRMTHGAFLRRAQEISNAHCDILGLTLEAHRKTHTVFLLSRMSIQVFARMPSIFEPVRIETRAYGMTRATFHRMTSIHTPAGEKLCEVDSRWVLVDTDSWRILRTLPKAFEGIFPNIPCPELHSLDIERPAELRFIEELLASYSRCDRNGHVNNAQYADIICDHLPIQQLAQGPPQKMLLYFRSEIPMEQSFTLSGGETESGFYFLASHQEAKHFEGFVIF